MDMTFNQTNPVRRNGRSSRDRREGRKPAEAFPRLPLCLGLLHWLLTFFLESFILTAPRTSQLFNYVVCKLILLPVLVFFWRFLWRALADPARKKNPERSCLLYALPYLAVIAVWLVCCRDFFLVGDEINIFTEAASLSSFAYWFQYPTGYFWIMSCMVLPIPMGPNLIKALLQALLAGYVVARQARLTGKRTALLLYPMFLLPFVLDLGVTAQRLPTYGVLFLFFTAKLTYDHLERRRDVKLPEYILLYAIVGILALWRPEGVYLYPFGFVLLCIAYRERLDRDLLKKLVLYAVTIAVVAVPQIVGTRDAPAPLSVRSKPLCGYILCNMFRNGLTEEMISEEREDIEGYLKLETIRRYNQELGDENYYQAYVMDGAEEADFAAQERFCRAAMHVALRHPGIYTKTQWNIWKYTNDQYGRSEKDGLPGLLENLSLASYRVAPACFLVLVFTVLYAVLRRWLSCAFGLCGLCNWLLVFFTKPAAYPKYFYVDYLLGLFFLSTAVCFVLYNLRSGKHERTH